MSELPTFSFVTPSFNRARRVEQMAKSVTNHNYHSVCIEDGCWIGAGVIMLGGVTIGPKAVIGAGSVVTYDIPARSTAVGNPSRVIKRWDLVLCSGHLVGQALEKEDARGTSETA